MANAMINKPNSKWLVMVEYRKKLSRYPITVSFLDTPSDRSLHPMNDKIFD